MPCSSFLFEKKMKMYSERKIPSAALSPVVHTQFADHLSNNAALACQADEEKRFPHATCIELCIQFVSFFPLSLHFDLYCSISPSIITFTLHFNFL